MGVRSGPLCGGTTGLEVDPGPPPLPLEVDQGLPVPIGSTSNDRPVDISKYRKFNFGSKLLLPGTAMSSREPQSSSRATYWFPGAERELESYMLAPGNSILAPGEENLVPKSDFLHFGMPFGRVSRAPRGSSDPKNNDLENHARPGVPNPIDL